MSKLFQTLGIRTASQDLDIKYAKPQPVSKKKKALRVAKQVGASLKTGWKGFLSYSRSYRKSYEKKHGRGKGLGGMF
jgi:hypothetical protein